MKAVFFALGLCLIGASPVLGAGKAARLSDQNEKVLQLYLAQDYKSAEVAARKAVSSAKRELSASSEPFHYAYINLAAILLARENRAEAEAILSKLVRQQADARINEQIRIQTLSMLLHNKTSDGPDPAKLTFLDTFVSLLSRVHGENSPVLVGPLLERSVAMYAVGRGQECVADIERVITIRKSSLPPSPEEDIDIRRNLAMCQLRARNFDEAIANFRDILATITQTRGASDETTLTVASDLGFALDQSGKPSDAAELALDVLEKRKKLLGESHPATIVSMINLASAYQQMGQYGDAEKLYLTVISNYDNRRSLDKWKISATGGLAEVYIRVGRFEEALKYIETGERDFASLEEIDISFKTDGLLQKAQVYQGMNDVAKATEAYKAIVEGEHDSSKDPIDFATAYGNLATLASKRGDIAAAKRYIQLAVDVENESKVDRLNTKLRQARIMLLDNEVAKATTMLSALLSDAKVRFGPSSAQTADVSNALAVAFIMQHNSIEAADLLGQTIRNVALYEAGEMSQSPDAEGLSSGSEAVIEAGSTALSAAFIEPSSPMADLASDFVLNYKSRVGDKNARLRAILRSGTGGTKTAAVVQEYLKLRNDFTAISRRVVDGDAGSLVALRPIEAKMRNMEAEIVRSTSNAAIADEFTQTADVQRNLPAGSALVEYFLYSPNHAKSNSTGEAGARYGAMVLLAGAERPVFVDLAASEEVQQLVSSISADFADRSNDNDVTRNLYDILIAKILPGIKDARRLYISTAGILGAVPFDMLVDGDGRRFVESDIDYRFIVSGRFLGVGPQSPTGEGLAAFGGADFDVEPEADGVVETAANNVVGRDAVTRNAADRLDGFAGLPGTGLEVQLIGEMWKAKYGGSPSILIGSQATEANLRKIASPRVLHMATHGVTVPLTRGDTLLPSLQVAMALTGANGSVGRGADQDGIVFGYEIEQLDLRGTELVVLSACETGIGLVNSFEGIIAVEQAFRRAGAKAVLATLHPISDAYTAMFMQDFYSTWINMANPDADDALRQVKVAWLRSEEPGRRDPKQWAPFVIINATLKP